MTETFRYRAVTGTGDVIDGIVHANSQRDAADSLRQQTLVPVSIESTTRQAGAVRMRGSRAGRRESIAGSVRTVATLLSAGVPLERAIDFATRHASHPDVAEAWRAVHADVRRGQMLSEAVRSRPLFGAFAAAVCRAGEESGTLDQALVRLAEQFERDLELRSQVRGALAYPAIMGVVAGVGVAVLLMFVVPKFVEILGDVGGELPLSTRMLVAASAFVIGAWWIWVPTVVIATLFVRWWITQPGNRRRWHAWRLRLPGIGPLEQNAATARFTSALGVLLNSGTPMLSAVRIAREGVGNEALAAELEQAGERIARGDRVAEAFAGPLPPLAVELMAAGEESGQLPAMCARVAATQEESVSRSLQGLVRMIEPVLILAFGAIVGFIALAMLQAVYSVNIGLP
jgi:general secretion pathway protein F